MNNFNIKDYPPSKEEIDSRLEQSKKDLSAFKRKCFYVNFAEVTALALAYAGGLALAKSIDSIGFGLLIIMIGPIVVTIAITFIATMHRNELKRVVEDLHPAHPNTHKLLKGIGDEVDRYLAWIEEVGRGLTQGEANMLDKFSRKYYRKSPLTEVKV